MTGLKIEGIIFLVVAYSVIIGLVIFCFSKVLKNNRTNSK